MGGFWHPLAIQLGCIVPAAGGPLDGAVGALPLCVHAQSSTQLTLT